MWPMTKPLVDTRTYIETPECVDLTFRLAGPGVRMGAYLIDLLLRILFLIILYILLILVTGMSRGLFASATAGVSLVILFLMEWGYGAVFEGFWNGQTPGKRYKKLRVVKTGGYPIHFYDATIRNLLRAADILPLLYGFGLISMIATKRMQRLGDLVAGTMVVIEGSERFARSNLVLSEVPRFQPTECPRRFHVSERTLEVIERLFDRKRALSPERREEIATSLARAIAEHLGYDFNHFLASEQPPRRLGPATWFLIRVAATFKPQSEAELYGERSAGKRSRSKMGSLAS